MSRLVERSREETLRGLMHSAELDHVRVVRLVVSARALLDPDSDPEIARASSQRRRDDDAPLQQSGIPDGRELASLERETLRSSSQRLVRDLVFEFDG